VKHLRVLEDAGRVVTRRAGREQLYFLDPVPMRLVHDRVIDNFTERRVAALTGRNVPKGPATERKRSAATEDGMSEDFNSIVDQARQDRTEGRRHEALTGYERAADLARAANDMGQRAHALRHVGDLQRELGHYRSAESAAAEAVTLYRQHGGASLDLANALRVLALAHESLGQLPEAEASWREAKPLYQAVGVLPGVHECDQHIARLGLA
jgi:tetratricopeptide (TPR) repeat protein